MHSQDCGGGTGIFLSVNSSTIIVVRGKRACVWGSVFLDIFGEEDKELKYDWFFLLDFLSNYKSFHCFSLIF